MNLRMVVLRDLAGNVHYVRNGKIPHLTLYMGEDKTGRAPPLPITLENSGSVPNPPLA